MTSTFATETLPALQTATLVSYGAKLTRQHLAHVPTPPGSATHRPVPHIEVIEALVETLGFRHIGVHREEYAVSYNGMKLFGILELDQAFYGSVRSPEGETGTYGCRFAIGIRNSHDKSMRLAMTVGYRVFVCQNMAFHGDFQPVLAKHSKHFDLKSALSVGVDDMQRNFTPMVEAVSTWQRTQLTDVDARLTIYRAFVEGALEVPHHLDRRVHDFYFNPPHEEFAPRTLWSLSNAFTAAFKALDPIPQFKATAHLGAFLNS